MADRSPYDAKTFPYDQPQGRWHCADFLHPCREGPTGGGRCQRGAACFPLKKGEKWTCGKTKVAGGNCEDGPDEDGNCRLRYPHCTPLPSRWIRRQKIFKSSTLIFVAVCLLTAGTGFNTVFEPGELHSHHSNKSCNECHSSQLESPFSFLKMGLGIQRGDSGQSERCQVCHDVGSHGKNPHSVPFQHLRAERAKFVEESPGLASLLPKNLPEEMVISCAHCHPQHHGADQPTTVVSDIGCTSCHGPKFPSFNEGHPEFTGELGRLPRRIKFNHKEHFDSHFLEKPEFRKDNCNGCHFLDYETQTFGYRSYEESCQECHEQEIASWEGTTGEPGFEIISIPWLDAETLEESGLSIGNWPSDGTDQFTPWMKNLLVSAGGGEDLELLIDPDLDITDLREATPAVLQAAYRSAWRLKESLASSLEDDVSVIFRSLAGDPEAKIPEPAFAPLAGALSHQLLRQAVDRWFPGVVEEVDRWKKGQPLEDEDPPTDNSPADDDDGPDAGERTRFGGWYRSYETLRYRPTGHADQTIRAWIESSGAADSSSEAAGEILKLLLAENAPGRCSDCHIANPMNLQAHLKQGTLWHPERNRAERGFTRFSHTPHVVRKSGLLCNDCHQISDTPAPSGSPDHLSVKRESCLECHGQQAPSRCTTCHPYHVEIPRINVDAPAISGED